METSKPNPEEIAAAFDFHKDADAILIGRTQIFVLTQTFLVVAFATVFSSSSDDIRKHILEVGIGILGILMSRSLSLRIRTVMKKLSFLKSNYLVYDDVYKSVISSEKMKPQKLQNWIDLDVSREFGYHTPTFVNLFWYFAIILSSSYFFIQEWK